MKQDKTMLCRRPAVLIGLPGCGKTALAAATARKMGCSVFDSDALIAEAEGMSITALFAQKGEAYFRQAEKACIEGLLARGEGIISVGGGAVLQCAQLLRAGSLVVYVRRSAHTIVQNIDSGTRPLLAADPTRLFALEAQRVPLYEACCHRILENEGSLYEGTQRLVSILQKEGFPYAKAL